MEKTKAKFEMNRPPSFELENNKQLAYKPASDFEPVRLKKTSQFWK